MSLSMPHRLVMALLLSGLSACPAHAAPQAGAGRRSPAGLTPQSSKTGAKTPAALQSQGLKIGEDVVVSKLKDMHIGQQAGDVILDGPGIEMESVNKTRGTHIFLIADHAVIHNRSNHRSAADLTGNVHYTLTEPIKEGMRTVQGTTQRAYYTEVNKGLQLLGSVNATLTDPSRFDGPATLRVTTLNIPGEGRFELLGDPNNTDVLFTPRATPAADAANANGNAAAKSKTTPRVGTIHVTGFRKGHLNQGEDAAFDGPLVVVETNNAQTKSQNTFKAPSIKAGLEEAKQSINAKGGIQFDTRTVNKRGQAQRLEGTANTAAWNEADATIEADGNITAKITNAYALQEPATLAAAHITATLSDEPRYVLTGSPERTRLAFNPRPAKGKGKGEKRKAESNPTTQVVPGTQTAQNNGEAPVPPAVNPPDKAAGQGTDKQEPNTDLEPQDPDQSDPTPNAQRSTPTLPFAFGSIVVSGFQTATYEPGTSITVAGPKVHFTSANSITKDFAEMFAPNVSADFDDANSIVAAKASGGVNYRFEQPLPKSKQMRWFTGDGRDVVLTNTEQSRQVQVESVGQLEYHTPTLPEPISSVFAIKDGILTYNLANGDFAAISPSRQMQSEFSTFAPPAKPATPTNVKKKAKRK